MKRLKILFNLLSPFLFVIFFLGACNKADQYDPSRFTTVDVVERIDKEVKRDSSISISIKYEENHSHNGEYPICLAFTLKNRSNLTQYIMPPFEDSHLGNPQFSITTENGEILLPQNYQHKRFFTFKYIKLGPNDSISFKEKIAFKYEFKEGTKYYITAKYYSRPVLLKDSLRKVESWCGYCESNTLQYYY